jgi:hypothetical protein
MVEKKGHIRKDVNNRFYAYNIIILHTFICVFVVIRFFDIGDYKSRC